MTLLGSLGRNPPCEDLFAGKELEGLAEQGNPCNYQEDDQRPLHLSQRGSSVNRKSATGHVVCSSGPSTQDHIPATSVGQHEAIDVDG